MVVGKSMRLRSNNLNELAFGLLNCISPSHFLCRVIYYTRIDKVNDSEDLRRAFYSATWGTCLFNKLITYSIKLQERLQRERERDRDKDQCFESEKPTIIDFNEQVTSFVNSLILQIAYVLDSKPPLIPN